MPIQKIEKGIKLPAAKSGSKKYPFEDMEVGDSFLVPFAGTDVKRRRLQSAILGSCRISRYSGMKFSTRSSNKGIRCWRVS